METKECQFLQLFFMNFSKSDCKIRDILLR